MTLCDVRVKLTWLCGNKFVLCCCCIKFVSMIKLCLRLWLNLWPSTFNVLSKWTIVLASLWLAEILFLNDHRSTFKSYVLNIFQPNKVFQCQSVSFEKKRSRSWPESWREQEATATLQMVSAAAWRLQCNISSLEEERRMALKPFLSSWPALARVQFS